MTETSKVLLTLLYCPMAVRIAMKYSTASGIGISKTAQILDALALGLFAIFVLLYRQHFGFAVSCFIICSSIFLTLSVEKLRRLNQQLTFGDVRLIKELWGIDPKSFLLLFVGSSTAVFCFTLGFPLTSPYFVITIIGISLLFWLIVFRTHFLHRLCIRFGIYTPWGRYHPKEVGFFVSFWGDSLESRMASKKSRVFLKFPYDSFKTRVRRNVYLFVAESLCDPMQWLKKPAIDPIDPRLRNWISGTAYAPVFGGSSIQAEFELLTGVPCGFKDSEYAFIALAGAPVPSIPRYLSSQGYTTTAYCASQPWFCNSYRAYQSLGFDSIRMKGEFPKRALDSGWTSIDAYLEYMQPDIERTLCTVTPQLVYAFFVSGHEPYCLDSQRNPGISYYEAGTGNEIANSYCNTVHFNTKRISDLIEWLRIKDPEALVLLTGDHQPMVGKRDYVTKRSVGLEDAGEIQSLYSVPYCMIAPGDLACSGVATHYTLGRHLLEVLSGTATDMQHLLRPIQSNLWVIEDGTITAYPRDTEGYRRFQNELESYESMYNGIISDGSAKR